MTYNGPLRMSKLSIQTYVAIQPRIQCANCFQFLIDKPKIRCSACKNINYCSTQCQEVHWHAYHKNECTKYETPFQNMQLRISDLEESNSRLLVVYQLPSAVSTLALVPYSQYNPEIQFAKYLIYCQNVDIQLTDEAKTFIKVEKPSQIFYYTKDETQHIIHLTNNFNPFETKIKNFDALRLICEECHGPADITTGECLKCKHVNKISLELPSGVNGENILQKTMELYYQSIYQLIFFGQDVEKAKKSQIILKKRLADSVKSFITDPEEFIRIYTLILKSNTFHHLSYPLYVINSYVYKQLQRLSHATYYKYLSNLLYPIDIYKLSFVFVKASIHHYGFFSSMTYENLYLVVQILNNYTLSQLESQGAPPLMRECNDRVQISYSEKQRMQEIAKNLLPGHNNCLMFAQQLRQLAEEIHDELIENDVQKLIGQIDCRIENLESWADEYEDHDQNYQEDDQNIDESEVDIANHHEHDSLFIKGTDPRNLSHKAETEVIG